MDRMSHSTTTTSSSITSCVNALVKSLTSGFPNRPAACQCINALSLCVVEMQDTMIKHLPQVLLNLSKISATAAIAIPFLEFLSYLALHPRLYKDFVSDQYLNIFAIVLPFTNPSKFSDYIVAMAFRVMSMWFLKCRLSYRKVIIGYIIRGLQVNVISSIKESEEIRKRSGSFNSDVALKSNESQSNANSQNVNSSLLHSNEKFHTELVESHMDLLSRYTQGLCSTLPDQSPDSDFLLDKSNSSTWLMGQKLITITTSGCRARTFVDGYCERCFRFCKVGTGSDFSNDDVFNPVRNSSTYNDPGNFNQPQDYDGGFMSNTSNNNSSENERNTFSSRRRHQSAIAHTHTNTSKPTTRAWDDSHLNSPYVTNDDYEESSTCSCWCEGWAEILIRRPSGTTSWKMRIQNRLNVPCYPCSPFDNLINDLTPIYPSKTLKTDDVDPDLSVVRGEDALASDTPESSPPVFRRTSSSPDMERGELIGQNSKNTSNSGSPATAKEATAADNGDNHLIVGEEDNDENSLAKLHRASSLGRADTKTSPFSRTPSFSWKSPSKFSTKKGSEVSTLSPGPDTSGKEVFFNSDIKTDNEPETLIEGKSYSSQTIISPLKATISSNLPSNSRTPPKTPAKLEDINESKTESFNPSVPRGRLATISVMSPALVKSNVPNQLKKSFSNQRITEISNPRNDGIKPSFIFLQLFYNSSISDENCKGEKPLMLPKSDSIKNALNNLDRILPHEIHKIGVIYIDTEQMDLNTILSNRFGSQRYTQFIRGLGTLIKLQDIDTSKCYTGGLAKDGQDGIFAINWQDNLTQVVFHVATFMPNKDNDPERKSKIAHIGNDCICIIYNNSGHDIDVVNNVRISKFVVAAIVIRPLQCETNLVMIQLFDEAFGEIIGPRNSIVLSDTALPSYIRQLSMNLNIASLIYHSKRSISTASLYASNCVERLRQIERIKQKTLEHIRNDELQNQKQFSSFTPSRSTMSNTDLEDVYSNQINCDKFPDDFTTYI